MRRLGFFFLFMSLTHLGLMSQEKLFSPILGFDAHQSRFLGEFIRVGGIKLGFKINPNIRHGIGFHFTDFVRVNDIVENQDTFLTKMSFNSAEFFFDYTVFENKKWQINLESALGSGRAKLSLQDTQNIVSKQRLSKRVLITTLASSVDYRFFYFLGLSVGGGYKFLPNRANASERVISDALNSFFYAIKIKVHIGDFYRKYFQS